MAKKNGRPSTITPKKRKIVCEWIKNGFFTSVARRKAEIPERTFRRWMEYGEIVDELEENPERELPEHFPPESEWPKYLRFWREVMQAELEREIALYGDKPSEAPWPERQWKLQRLNPERYNPPQRRLLGNDPDNPIPAGGDTVPHQVHVYLPDNGRTKKQGTDG